MAGPGICVLCLADTCTSEVHPVFNPVAPYGYLLSDMYFEFVLSPFVLTCNMMRFLSLLLLGLCACVIHVVVIVCL